MGREEFLQRIRFIVHFGRGLHSVGAPAHTLEASLMALCDHFGLKGSFLSIPTAIICSFRFGDEELTRIVRVHPSGVHLGRLTQVDEVSQQVLKQGLSLEEGSQRLEEIFESKDDFPAWMTIGCFVLTSAGMMTLFGGSWGDFLVASLTGLLIGILSLPKHFGIVSQLYEAIMALTATVLAGLFGKISPDINLGAVILASLIMFVPGLNITISIAEIATHNLTSGTSRLMGGFMILLKLAFGVFVGSKLVSYIHIQGLAYSFRLIPDWITIISVPVVSLMSTVVFKAKWREAKWITLAGVFGYTCSKVGTFYLGSEMGLFLGGIAIGAGANVFARLADRPSSIFQFPGLILLVPGSMGYRGLAYLYAKDIVLGFDTAFTMLALAFSLVVGVFVGNLVVKPRRNF